MSPLLAEEKEVLETKSQEVLRNQQKVGVLFVCLILYFLLVYFDFMTASLLYMSVYICI